MKRYSLPIIIAAAICGLVLAAVVFIPSTPAYASDPYMDQNIPTSGMKNSDIEAMNQHEIAWLLSQNQVFRDANQVDSDFQDLVNGEVSKRGGALPLVRAFSDFETALAVAQSVHDQAAKVIGAQWGFNAKGKVTNREAALQTVMDARYSLRDAHYRLVVTIHAFHRIYADWHAQFTRP